MLTPDFSKSTALVHVSEPSPEVEILLCCARVAADPVYTRRIEEALGRGVDWEQLLHLAEQHGMTPLLYWHLNSANPAAMPPRVLDKLRALFQANAQRNLLLTRELLRLLRLFEAQGIPALPYKGPVLAALVYGNLALRRFGDLDIVVRQHDLSRVKELLIAVGYEPERLLTGAQEEAFARFEYNQPFMSADGQCLIELHWALAPPYFCFSLTPQDLWPRLDQIELAGTQVLTPAAEDLLLMLCAHGTKHLWERLEWVCCVAELIRVRPELDWEQIINSAVMLGSKRMLFLGLLLAHELLETDLPEEVLSKVQATPCIKALAGQVCERLFQRPLAEPGFFGITLFHLRTRERLRDKAQYCLRRLFTPTHLDLTFSSLPPSLSSLYYLLRPIRLTLEWRSYLSQRL